MKILLVILSLFLYLYFASSVGKLLKKRREELEREEESWED